MVWSQYVYEANYGLDVDEHLSGEEDSTDPSLNLTVHTFWDEFNDELWFLFDWLQVLLYDAVLRSKVTFDDFVDFCYYEEDDTVLEEDERLVYIWDKMQRLDTTNLMGRKQFGTFCRFINLEE
ncbi:hypothetical protein DSLPV1_108 [Dishui lake phycodnavirus 1]|uniref:hypothetical protein n=1 Tax=Dishui lake phycodnavirus 1 TaxID=2079134 RepID=UPI000CD68378|nr:hypothetical protein C5Y57_gp108 [Dishui lake phycodnavirus 1]AUT19079.1 hypothetical protein DSLPV1_108 [Dishui lake phycodnavirus 1]